MESIRDYLLSVTAAALICGIISSLTGKSSNIPKVLKLLCGLFLCDCNFYFFHWYNINHFLFFAFHPQFLLVLIFFYVFFL